jgi:hypothetical protein
MKSIFILLITTLFFYTHAFSQCAPTTAIVATTTSGNNGGTGNLGSRFTVNNPIQIEQLGAYDDFSNGFSSTITVTIHNWVTGAIVGSQQTFNGASPGTLSGGFRMKAVTPFVLQPGDYIVSAVGYNSSNQFFNSTSTVPTKNTLGGYITWGLDYVIANTTVTKPTTSAGSTFYHAVSFIASPYNSVSGPTNTLQVCQNVPINPITHTTTLATGIGTPTGLPAGLTATWAANTITISGTPTGAGTYSYSIPLTGGCGAVNATGQITFEADCADCDNDGVANFNDIDDDNDGVLDAVESCPPLLATGSWVINSPLGTHIYTDLTNDVRITVNQTNYTTFWDGTIPSNNAMDASCSPLFNTTSATAINASNSLQIATGNAGAGGVTSGNFKVTYTNAAGTSPKTVLNPRLHMGRLGGTAQVPAGGPYVVNSSSWQLIGGKTMTKLSGNTEFGVTSTVIEHSQIGSVKTQFGECSAGMGGGTVIINGALSEFEFVVTNLDNAGLPTTNPLFFDGVRVILEHDLPCDDIDGDGVLNSCDTDSDNDGCPDAVEARVANVGTTTVAGPYGANGLANSIETNDLATATTTNVPNYSVANYTNEALNATANTNCLDCDNDGVANKFDVDDDNDGISDVVELACYPEINSITTGTSNGNNTSVTSTFGTGTFSFTETSSNWYVTPASITNNSACIFGNSNFGTYALNNSDVIAVSGISGTISATTLNFSAPTSSFLIYVAGMDNVDIFFSPTATLTKLSGNADLAVNNLNTTFHYILSNVYNSAGPNGTTSCTNPTTSSSEGVVLVTLSGPVTATTFTLNFGSVGGGPDSIYFHIRPNTLPCSLDQDNDGVINSCDLDSDGDGCNDAFEAGATTSVVTNFSFPLPVNASGAPSVPAYTSTYSVNALNPAIKTCCGTIDAGANSSACVNGSATLTGSITIGLPTWSADVANPAVATFGTPSSVSTTISGLTTAGSYKFYLSNGACKDSMILTVNPLPVVTATGTSPICEGASTTITGAGADTYTINPGGLANAAIVSPTATTTYTVIGTSVAGCTSETTITITVNPLPVVTATGTSPICEGASTTITGAGADTYTINPGGLANAATVSPTATTTYTVIGTSVAGCTSETTITITVNPLPVVNATGTSPICEGASPTITGAGADSYTINPGGLANAATVSPTVTTTYTVIGTSVAGCTSETTITITVNPLPVVTATGTSPICEGASTTITGAGADTYTINLGGLANAATVSPTATTTYTVIGTSVAGCTSETTITITVNPLPVVTATGTSPICEGASTTITGAGADTYTINPGSLANAATVSPTATTTYTVIGTSAAGCTSETTITVTVNPLPVVTATGTLPICEGASTAITGAGADTYTINPGGLTNAATVSPTATTTYTVIGTSVAGCTSETTITITVNPLPVVTATGTSPICEGASTIITGAGADTYTINPGGLANAATVSPTATTTYTVIGTSVAGCTSETTITVTVNPLPVVTATGTSPICEGASTTITGAGADTYTINPGGLTNAATVSPTATTTYTVIGTSAAGCTSETTITITVNPLPVTLISTLIQPNCSTATGVIAISLPTEIGMTYSNDNITYTNTNGTFNNVASGTYTISAKSSSGCIGGATTVTILPAPTTPIAPSASVSQPTCTESTGIITISNPTGVGITYSIDGINYTNSTGIFTAIATGTYSLTAKNSDGCISPETVVIVSTQPVTPAAPTVTPSTTTICNGTSTILNATGCNGDVTWYNTDAPTLSIGSGSSLSITPTATSSYIATCTNTTSGCTSLPSTPSTITVIIPPVGPSISVDNATICEGNSIILTGISCSSPDILTWTKNGAPFGTGLSLTDVPTVGTYTFAAICNTTGAVSCASAASNLIVVVNALPAIPVITATPTTICAGSTAMLTATGAVGSETYSWSDGQTGSSITVSPLNTTNYTVKILNTTTNCESALSAPITVTVTPTPSSAPMANAMPATICSGDTAMLNATCSLGSAQWYTSNLFTTITPTSVSPSATTTYYVRCENNGCFGPALPVTLTVNATPSKPIVTINQPICPSIEGSVTINSPTGINMTYSVDNVAYTNINGIFPALAAGTYTASAQSEFGCFSDTTIFSIDIILCLDTIIETPKCPTCTTPPICASANSLPTSSAPISYTTCGATPMGMGTFSSPDANGCITFTGNGTQGPTDTITNCIVACKNGICDTTFIIINPPMRPDTVILTPLCITCPVTACVNTADLPNSTGVITFSTCGAPNDYTASTIDVNGCVTYAPIAGFDTITDYTCIVACKDGICDTTYVIIESPLLTVSGTVFNDINGNADTIINGTGTNAGGLNAYAIDVNGNAIAYGAVQANGTYTITEVKKGTVKIILSDAPPPPTQIGVPVSILPNLPATWVSTGEKNFSILGNDGSVNTTSAEFILSNTNILDINFGIEQPPIGTDTIAPGVVNPGGGFMVTVPAALFNGEDLITDLIDSLNIINYPANVDSISINGIVYNSSTWPVGGVTVATTTNGQPLVPILIDPVDGVVSVPITYTLIDEAGLPSINPITVTIPFIFNPLSITFADYTAKATGCDVNINWRVANSDGIKQFDIYESNNGLDFKIVKTIKPSNNELNYQTLLQPSTTSQDLYYYINALEHNGTTSKSKVLKVNRSCDDIDIKSYPNPMTNNLYAAINNVKKNATLKLVVLDAVGKTVYRIETAVFAQTQNIVTIDGSKLATGLYKIEVNVAGQPKQVLSIQKQ